MNPQLDTTIQELLDNEADTSANFVELKQELQRVTIPAALSMTPADASQLLRSVNLKSALRELETLRSFSPASYAIVLQFFRDSAK